MGVDLNIRKKDARAWLAAARAREAAARRAMWSLIAVAAGHVKQLQLIQDARRYVLVMCSRRAGKTFAMAVMLLTTAMNNPGSNSIYIALTRGQAKKTIWNDIWVPLCAKWGIECDHNKADLATTFPNGAHVYFTGSDDIRHIETELGSKLSMAIVDECQSQGTAVLERLVTNILPPALSDCDGRLLLAGTIPETPAGYFWQLWKRSVDLGEDESGWARYNWSRFENPHLEDQERKLAEHLKATGLTEEDPLIQRDWRGVITFDISALAFRYDRDRNGFAIGTEERDPMGQWVTRIAPKEIIDQCDSFSVGGDQGGADRCVLEVNGWGKNHRNVYQVYEWATKRNHAGAWSGFGPRLDQIRRMFNPDRHFFDFSGSTLTLDNFTTDFGVYVLHAAKKADRKGQVDRTNDLLMTGRHHVMWGSDLEGDFLKTQWDKDDLAKRKWDWSSHNHPDAADADRYSLQGFFDAYVPPPPPVPEEAKYFDDGPAKTGEWYERDLQEILPDRQPDYFND